MDSLEILGRLPFLNGLYVAVDAIDGAFLVVDGPYCVFTKAEMQYGHNLNCRLSPPLGRSRVVHTAVRPGMEEVTALSADRLERVDRVFREVCGWPEAELVFATAFDFHQLLNFPLAGIARRHAASAGKPVCHIPSKSLGGDWRDGYAGACEALARELPLPKPRPRKHAVAAVGYFFDRDEPDHAANVKELRRILKGIGLDLVSTWLSGGGIGELQRAAEASLIVSLPYAREAARRLGRRLGVPVLRAELPIGLTATDRFLAEVAAAAGRAGQASRFAAREARAAVRATETHVRRLLRGRAASLDLPDPVLRVALQGLLEDLGMRGAAEAAAAEPPRADAGRPAPAAAARRAEPAVSLGPLCPYEGAAWVPFGYPNYAFHPVVERPFLGYAGFRHLVDRIAAAALEREAAADAPPAPGR